MASRLPATNVAIVGLGWTGAILAEQLTAAGLDVVAIERGPWRDTATDFPPTLAPDELRYAIRQELILRPAQATLTFRNTPLQTALPVRAFASFLPGNGVGGAGVHWSGQAWRLLEADFLQRSHATARYGRFGVPFEMTIQDWGLTARELEPCYDRFEYMAGISGQAGNLLGTKQPGGNPFEAPRARPYPLPPLPMTAAPTLFAKAAKEMGFAPFPGPAGNAAQAYTNPLGVTMAPCTCCGFCAPFGCGISAKASPQACLLPALMRRSNFTLRTDSEVLRILTDLPGRRATGVAFADLQGQDWEQPADLVLLCAQQVENVRLLLLSGIGTPYDPRSGTGTVGRNLSCQTTPGRSCSSRAAR